MHLKAIFAGLLAGSVFMIILPLLVMYINNYFGLIIIQSIIFLIIGIILILIGVSIFIYCTLIFLRLGHGTPAPIDPPRKLVIDGLYSYTRNPIYLGYFSILTGWYMIFGHFLLFIYLIIIMISIHLYVVRFEEPKLRKRFGKDYEDYFECVPRWL